jgi:hypothetical protein
MLSENTIEIGNAQLAAFDELDQIKNPALKGEFIFRVPNLYPFRKMTDPDNTGYIDDFAYNLEYHQRFDWLIPIVKRIGEVDILAAHVPPGFEGVFYALKKCLNNYVIAGDIEKAYLQSVRIVQFLKKVM